MKKSIWILVVPILLYSWSCTQIGFEKTRKGLEYKIFHVGKGEKLKPGDFVKFDYKVTYKDSVIASSYEFMPGYDIVDSVGRPHDFSEILKDMNVGDSAVCYQLYDSLAKINPYAAPPYMKKGDKQKMTIHVLAAITGGREKAFADYEKEVEKYKEKELAVIEGYLKRNEIAAHKTKDGVFVEVQTKGDGPAADSGKLVSIKYTGYNLAGKFFDSNTDTTKQVMKHGLEPYSFISRQQGAIPGMLLGISEFNQGGKGRMFIPSIMAYGPQGSPPAIGPNENLVFDVEVVEVKEPPAPGPRNLPPGLQHPDTTQKSKK